MIFSRDYAVKKQRRHQPLNRMSWHVMLDLEPVKRACPNEMWERTIVRFPDDYITAMPQVFDDHEEKAVHSQMIPPPGLLMRSVLRKLDQKGGL